MASSLRDNWTTIFNSVPAQRIGNFEVIKKGNKISLIEHRSSPHSLLMWMSIGETELCLYEELPILAHGQVLIAGLGLGFDLLNVVTHDDVDDILVVENQHDVIDLVWPYLSHQKTTLVYRDILEHLHNTADKFDVIYLDIFPGGYVNFSEIMIQLHQAAQSCLRPDGRVLFWCESKKR